MFGLGFGEIVIILVVALILLGPQRLPDVAKQLGKGLREFKKATDDLKGQFETELYSDHKPAPRPSLVQPPAQGMPVPASPPAPAATAENVPGLDAAVAEPVSVKPEPPPVPPASEAQAAEPVEPA